jgi:UDPglucose--hexose-1-phosphate uridylyltransferase
MPGWRVRAFPNLYPIVGGPGAEPGADGAHEVVVVSPDHRRSFADLDDEEAVEVLQFTARRVRAQHDAGRSYACAFVNQGRAAGASIAHAHAQVIGLDHVPPAVDAGLARFAASDPIVDDLGRAAALPVSGAAVAWCPFASTSPGLVRVAHPDAGNRFDDAHGTHVAAVAVALRSTLAALRTWLGDPAYNVLVHSAPPGDWAFHWYVEIVPRVSVLGGFELLTGVLVNTVPPEDADAALRAALP